MNSGPERTVQAARDMLDTLRAHVAAGEMDRGQASTAALMAAYYLAKETLTPKRVAFWAADCFREWRRNDRGASSGL